MECEFFLNMVPPTVTHQEKSVTVKNGKPVFFENHRLKAARSEFVAALALHKPERPLKGAIQLLTKWCFYDSRITEPRYKVTKPDTDNSIKLLKDCMTRVGFWADDAQVASEITEKFLVPNRPGIYIFAKELDDEN